MMHKGREMSSPDIISRAMREAKRLEALHHEGIMHGNCRQQRHVRKFTAVGPDTSTDTYLIIAPTWANRQYHAHRYRCRYRYTGMHKQKGGLLTLKMR